MPIEHAVFALVAQKEGQRRRDKPFGCGGDQRRQARIADHLSKRRRIVLAKDRLPIHGVPVNYPFAKCQACGFGPSKNLSTMAPCVAPAPARSAAATSDASTTSSRLAPAAFAPFACAS